MTTAFGSLLRSRRRYVLFLHKYIGNEAVVNISVARNNADQAAALEFLQPLLSSRAVELAQFGRADPAECDALLR